MLAPTKTSSRFTPGGYDPPLRFHSVSDRPGGRSLHNTKQNRNVRTPVIGCPEIPRFSMPDVCSGRLSITQESKCQISYCIFVHSVLYYLRNISVRGPFAVTAFRQALGLHKGMGSGKFPNPRINQYRGHREGGSVGESQSLGATLRRQERSSFEMRVGRTAESREYLPQMVMVMFYLFRVEPP